MKPKRKRTLLFLAATLFLGGGPGAALLACGETAGRRVTFETRAVSETNAFRNALGWDVTLSRALLATGPLYFFDGEPDLARRTMFLRTAWAHPGHYAAGNAHGEMTTSWTIDLLTANALPPGRGVTGSLRSARVGFASPPSGPHRDALGDAVVVVAGVATRGDQSVSFTGRATLGEVVDAEAHPQVDGCAFRAADVQSDGVVTFTVRPSVWLDQVDFAGVTGDLTATPVAQNAFARGVKKSAAYSFSFEPETP